MLRIRYTVMMVALATCLPNLHAQQPLRRAPERRVTGMIEMSVGAATSNVVVTIDLPTEAGKYDGNIEAGYIMELAAGVAKPQPFKAVGTLQFKDSELLAVDLTSRKLLFSLSVPVSAEPNGVEKRVYGIREGRHAGRGGVVITHRSLADEMLPVKHPFRRSGG